MIFLQKKERKKNKEKITLGLHTRFAVVY